MQKFTATWATNLVESGATASDLRAAYNNAEYVRSNLTRMTKQTYTGVENDQARLAEARAAVAILRKARRELAKG